MKRDPDNDQDYFSLALLEFRKDDIATAKQTLLKGQTHIPRSGKIVRGLGLASALEGDATGDTRQLWSARWRCCRNGPEEYFNLSKYSTMERRSSGSRGEGGVRSGSRTATFKIVWT